MSQQEIYTVFCFIIDEDVIFPIDIAQNKTVGHLKEFIKPSLDHIAAAKLKLYHMEVASDDDVVEIVTRKMAERPPPAPLRPTKKLVDIFDSTPKQDTIHIIVELPGKRKRDSSDAGDQDTKRARLIQDIPSHKPSSFKLKDMIRLMGGQVVYNRSKASYATVPIALVHPVFATFLEDCQYHRPTKQDNEWLAELRRDMLKRYPDEGARCNQFRQIFEDHTGIQISNALIPGAAYRTDGHFAFAGHFLIITEGTNEWIGMVADPQLQAFLYYIATVKHTNEFKGSPLPCLIIYYVGSLIGFAGVVIANEKPYFEALTPIFDLATNQHDALALKPVARALSTVRAALNSLKEYYTELKGPQPSHSPINIGFPSRNYYTNDEDARVEFNYKARLNTNKLLFRILTKEGKQKLVVKFTQKYSKEAHAHCASHGIAPALYAVEKLGGGWLMVVMEDLEDTYTLFRQADATQHAVVKDAVSMLHKGNFVHGDIRCVNVMVRRN